MSSHQYRVSGVTLASDLPLPELTLAPRHARPDCTLRGLADLRFGARPRWTHHWRFPDGRLWLSLGRAGSAYRLRFTDRVDFAISADGARITYCPRGKQTPDTIRHLALDQVLPLALAARGHLVLHASAVATPAGGVAFLAGPGLGKSTLAASFAAAGSAIICDDCLVIDDCGSRLHARGSYPSVRLWPDAATALFDVGEVGQAPVADYTQKVRVRVDGRRLRFCEGPTPLARVYVLDGDSSHAGDTSEVRINPLSRREAFLELLKHSYRLDVRALPSLRDDFDRLARAANRMAIARLAFPRELARLGEVRDAIVRDLDRRVSDAPIGAILSEDSASGSTRRS